MAPADNDVVLAALPPHDALADSGHGHATRGLRVASSGGGRAAWAFLAAAGGGWRGGWLVVSSNVKPQPACSPPTWHGSNHKWSFIFKEKGSKSAADYAPYTKNGRDSHKEYKSDGHPAPSTSVKNPTGVLLNGTGARQYAC